MDLHQQRFAVANGKTIYVVQVATTTDAQAL